MSTGGAGLFDGGAQGQGRPGRDDLVGRRSELAAAREALAGTGAVLLSGPAGIGRTAMARSLAHEAARTGATVLRCTPAEEERALPYVGLGDLLADLPAGRLEALLDPLADLPRRALEAALLRGRRPGSAQDRLALPTGLVRILRVLAADAGLLIVLDGLQWLDGPSAEALRFALRRVVGVP
ncbi:ATP-binding protein, partial [Kitasatospora nipponensis]|uniref:ATP-binding protein n=1 Tax=Kitasatospora nipponensis TaxID=258049 RepID=UPI0031D71B5F